jgi:hypothetical protein
LKHKAVAPIKDATVFRGCGSDSLGYAGLIESFNLLKVLGEAWRGEFRLGAKAHSAGGRQN